MKEVAPLLLLKTINEKRLRNALLSLGAYAASWMSGRPHVWGYPLILTVEPTNRCNLRCPQCLTGAGKIKRGFHNLSFDDFKHIIDELGDYLFYLILFNQGEPFLHPQLIDFISYAKRKKIYVTTSTNGHFFRDSKFVHKTISSGLDTLVISLDGADPHTYETYRTGGNFIQVIEGIKKLVEVKERLGLTSPNLVIQFLVMRHNEHQIAAIKRLGDEIGADRVLLKTVQITSEEDANEFLPKAERYRRYVINNNRLKMKTSRKNPCRRLWVSTVINSDGCVVPCCFDKDSAYSFGSIHDAATSIRKIWRSKKYQNFRELLLRTNDLDICQNCTEGTKIFY